MNAQVSHTATPRPNAGSWLFAWMSALITLTIAILVLTAGFLLTHRLVLREVQSAIRESRPNLVVQLFPILENGTEQLEDLFSLISGNPSYHTRRQARLATFNIGFKRNLMEPEEVERAIADLQQFRLRNLELAPQAHIKTIHEHLQNIKKNLSFSKQRQDRISEITAREKKLIDQHILLGEDLTDLLSLPCAYTRLGGTELRAYTSGILQYLPVLDGLDDDLTDLQSLKTALEQAGGKVNVSGDNPAEIFAEKVRGLRAISEELVTEFSQLHTEKEMAEEMVAASLQEVQNSISTIQGEGGSLLCLLTETELILD
jgi:hypothetical protein